VEFALYRQTVALFDLDFFELLPIQIEVSDTPLTSDAGLLPLRQFDHRIGLTKQIAAVLDDPRHPASSNTHSLK
jgi:hypothetical protein